MIFHSAASKLDFKGYQAVYEVSSKFILYLLLASSMDFNLCLCYFYQALTSLMAFFFMCWIMHQRHCLMVQGPIVSAIAFSHLHDLLLTAIIIGVWVQPGRILCIWLYIFAQTFLWYGKQILDSDWMQIWIKMSRSKWHLDIRLAHPFFSFWFFFSFVIRVRTWDKLSFLQNVTSTSSTFK